MGGATTYHPLLATCKSGRPRRGARVSNNARVRAIIAHARTYQPQGKRGVELVCTRATGSFNTNVSTHAVALHVLWESVASSPCYFNHGSVRSSHISLLLRGASPRRAPRLVCRLLLPQKIKSARNPGYLHPADCFVVTVFFSFFCFSCVLYSTRRSSSRIRRGCWRASCTPDRGRSSRVPSRRHALAARSSRSRSKVVCKGATFRLPLFIIIRGPHDWKKREKALFSSCYYVDF